MTPPAPARVRTWPPPGATPADACADLAPFAAALSSAGPAIAPDPAVPDLLAQLGGAGEIDRLPTELAIVVATSGSTGAAKHSLLTAAAVTASGRATEQALGGPGHWLLALPPTHIAGLQVLARSILAGTVPLGLASGSFQVDEFVALTAQLAADGRRYTSLVPTQLVRLLDDPAGVAALRCYDAILVGGAALAPTVHQRAVMAGARIVRTYGMSETAGGCVYDGVPLPDMTIRLDDAGRISLGGPTVAAGYLERVTDDPFSVAADGTRWFRTDDLGEVTDGVLRVIGRADDLIMTGAIKVAPSVVESAVLQHVPGAAEAVAVGLPDEQWGELVAVAIRFAGGAPRSGQPDDLTATVREALRPHLPAYALPRRAVAVDAIPLRGPGKPDRLALREALSAAGD